MKTWMFFLLFGMMIVGRTHGQAPEGRMEAAIQAYQQKNYEAAIAIYESLLQQQYHSEALYYNLGNCYYRTGKLAACILHYERALLLDPNDKDILANLELARQQLQNPGIKIPQSAITKWWFSAQNLLSAAAWGAIGILLLWLLAGGIWLWWNAQSRRWRKIGFISAVIALFLCLFPFTWAFARHQAETGQHYAILMSQESPLRAAPEAESQAVQALYEGIKVKILDQIGAWYKVRLEDTTEGWLPMDVVTRI
ncbi:MAG TPA: tetratricopeptide repeat protein [Saprospiraceae bacterium]|nr:tetratricopeptide repeat protein [Saprospiraceae bacterium]HMQ85583.1 tetratricopeptide repeat protein [Saprospiraceae bacterium]